MSKAPNRLFIKPCEIKAEMIPGGELPHTGIQYVRKDILVQWAKDNMPETKYSDWNKGYEEALMDFIEELNTL